MKLVTTNDRDYSKLEMYSAYIQGTPAEIDEALERLNRQGIAGDGGVREEVEPGKYTHMICTDAHAYKTWRNKAEWHKAVTAKLRQVRQDRAERARVSRLFR